MELWTEYEGRTIDGAFPLTKLLRPEGRSAFFLTLNGTGVQRIVRLIEPHFDEDEILARWREVATLDHPNILKLEKFGQVMLDDASLLYAVMEPADANLGEVVIQQRLTVPEATQLANSLISALESLHSHGFVHEHVEPANVLAVGEVVKLRCDCIREAPEGEEGRELKRRDVHDFAVMLLQALTQERTMETATRDLPLPAPFDQIVRKGMSGEWGVGEIAAAMKEAASVQDAPPAVVSSETRPAPARTTSLPSGEGERSAGPKAGFGAGLMVVAGLAVVLVLWLGWHFLHRPANQSNAQQETSTPVPALDSGAARSATASAPVAAAPPTQKHPAPGVRDQWRVISYTYNHEEQAQQKSATIARMHPELRPEVFTPTGHAPYLVAIGGKMSRDEAFALVQEARSEGLPSDTYAQNYSGKEP